MQNVDYAHFDFGDRLNGYIQEVMNYGGAPRTESELTEGQKVFVRAVKREMVKYADPNRHGYPHKLLEQMESFTRTIGDLHNSYFDSGMRKVSDCLYNRWKMLYETGIRTVYLVWLRETPAVLPFHAHPREGDRRVPANLYQRFAFNLSWSPEDLKEVPLKPRPHGDRASAAQLRKYRGG